MAKEKSSTKAVAKKSSLRGELDKLLDELDDTEIAWIVKQTKTIIHNHKVAEMNKASRSQAKKKTVSKKSSAVDVVQMGSTKNFNILWDNARLFVNLGELKALVKIAHSDSGNVAGKLYRWFQRERKDIIIDGNISGPADQHVKNLAKVLKEKFSTG